MHVATGSEGTRMLWKEGKLVEREHDALGSVLLGDPSSGLHVSPT